MKESLRYTSVDEYIALQPPALHAGLQILRETIRAAAPEAVETISYNMPAYRLHTVLVYFAAGKGFYGFYPTSGPIVAFRDELIGYETSKGTIHFSPDKPIPVKLVKAIVQWRVTNDKARAAMKKKK